MPMSVCRDHRRRAASRAESLFARRCKVRARSVIRGRTRRAAWSRLPARRTAGRSKHGPPSPMGRGWGYGAGPSHRRCPPSVVDRVVAGEELGDVIDRAGRRAGPRHARRVGCADAAISSAAATRSAWRSSPPSRVSTTRATTGGSSAPAIRPVASRGAGLARHVCRGRSATSRIFHSTTDEAAERPRPEILLRVSRLPARRELFEAASPIIRCMDVVRTPQAGWIEVIVGSMFSGKSEELIRRLRRAQIARQRVQIFKPAVDTRYARRPHRVAQRAAHSVGAGARLGRLLVEGQAGNRGGGDRRRASSSTPSCRRRARSSRRTASA